MVDRLRRLVIGGSVCLLAAVSAAAQEKPQQKPDPAKIADPAKPEQPAAPAGPKLTFPGAAGELLIQIKPGQGPVFEEMMARLQAGLARTENATLKQQAAGFAVYRAAEPFGGNAVYVVRFEPTVPGVEYDLFTLFEQTLTDEEKKGPGLEQMWDRYAAAFAAGYNRLSLTPVNFAEVLEKVKKAAEKKDADKKLPDKKEPDKKIPEPQ